MRAWVAWCAVVLVGLAVLVGPAAALQITSLAVPSWGEEGLGLELSCSYSLPTAQYPELDVKWYHGSSPAPFLLSLPHLQPAGPQLVGRGPLLGHIQPSLHPPPGASAFRLSNLTLGLSGLFTCKVSTFTQEAVASRRLTVIRRPRSFLLEVEEERGVVAAACRAQGGLPAPALSIAACGRTLPARLSPGRGLAARLSRGSLGSCASLACTQSWRGTNLSQTLSHSLEPLPSSAPSAPLTALAITFLAIATNPIFSL